MRRKEKTKLKMTIQEFFNAIDREDLAEVTLGIEEGIDINRKYEDDRTDKAWITPIQFAIYECRNEVVKFFLYIKDEIGLNIEEEDEDTGDTLLFYAIRYGNLPVVKMLLDAGANIFATTRVTPDWRTSPPINVLEFAQAVRKKFEETLVFPDTLSTNIYNTIYDAIEKTGSFDKFTDMFCLACNKPIGLVDGDEFHGLCNDCWEKSFCRVCGEFIDDTPDLKKGLYRDRNNNICDECYERQAHGQE